MKQGLGELTTVALVTGVSRGLGEALALSLLEAGAVVMGIGRKSSDRLGGDRYRFFEVDLARVKVLDAALAPALEAARSLDPHSVFLINNAAVAGPVGISGELPPAAAAESLDVNLSSVLILCNAFCRVFSRPDINRRIVNISSGAAQSPISGNAPYCVAKAGIEMLTKVISEEQRDPTFSCIAVQPGVIDTEMQTYMRSKSPSELPSVGMFKEFESRGLLKAPAEVAERLVKRLVIGAVSSGTIYTHRDF